MNKTIRRGLKGYDYERNFRNFEDDARLAQFGDEDEGEGKWGHDEF